MELHSSTFSHKVQGAMQILLGLGSNVGERGEHLHRAIDEIEQGIGHISCLSSVHETDPVLHPLHPTRDQARFLNMVVQVETQQDPTSILQCIQDIEQRLGRERSDVPWSPRTIDIDLIAADDAVLAMPGLVLPHPEMHRRPFVLEPLREIAPAWRHPVTGLSIDDMLRELRPDRPTTIIGVLNVTPDSYYDGGKYAEAPAASERVEEMIAEGVDIVEIGAESTGPGSPHIDATEEIKRLTPILKGIREAYPHLALSIDTYKAPVAALGLAYGACMINDVTAGRGDSALFPLIAQSSAQLVLMYSKDSSPRTTIDPRQYEDVGAEAIAFLHGRRAQAIAAGIPSTRILLDPGMGHFLSSDPRISFRVLDQLRRFTALGPVCISPSRKSFLAGTEQLSPHDRLPGTIAASAIAVLHGASYIRTHDVAAVRRGCEIALQVRISRDYDVSR